MDAREELRRNNKKTRLIKSYKEQWDVESCEGLYREGTLHIKVEVPVTGSISVALYHLRI